jgi:hypothetical protein
MTTNSTTVVTASGKRLSLSSHADQIIIDSNAPRLSVEYAKARDAIQADFRENFKMNQPMAKRMKRQSKETVIEFLGGKVSKKVLTPEDKDYNTKRGGSQFKMLVTFPDNSVARL